MPQAKPSYLDETQAYLTDLDLDYLPFTNISNGRFVYLSEAYKELWSRVESIVESAAELVVLVGPRGIGKTTQFEHAADFAEGKWQCRALNAAVLTTPTKLIEILAQDLPLALEGETHKEKISELVGYWESLIDDGMIPVLLIDDAHLLSPALLEILFHLSQLTSNRCRSGFLHLILFSDTSLHKSMLDIAYCRQHIKQVAEINILPLTDDMVQEYLEFRLKAAGYQGGSLFSKSEVEQLLMQSDGLPGKLNLLAQEMLISKKRQKDFLNSTFNFSLKKAILTIMATMLISILALYLINPSAFKNILNFKNAISEKSQKLSEINAVPKINNAIAETVLSQHEPVSGKSKSNDIENGLTSDVKKEEVYLDAVNNINDESTRNEKEITKKVFKDSETGVSPQAILDTDTDRKNNDLVFEQKMRDAEDWLLKRDPNHYTIQLIGSSKQSAMQTFMDKNGLHNKAILLRTKKFNRPWYSIVKGDYATVTAAAQAIKELEPGLQRHQPWRRSFLSIQNEVKNK